MSRDLIILIVLSGSLLILLAIGLFTKRHTARRLKEIDGLVGIIKKGHCKGMPIMVLTQAPASVDVRRKGDKKTL